MIQWLTPAVPRQRELASSRVSRSVRHLKSSADARRVQCTVARARGGGRPRSGITPPSLSPRCASPGASPPPARAPGASITPRGADGYGVTVDLATRGGGRQVSAGRSHLPAWRVDNLLTRKYLANRYATLSQARYSRQPSDRPTHNRHRALEIEPSGAYILLRGSARSHASFLWRRSEALSVTAWAGGMTPASPLSRRARCLLVLSHRSSVLTASPSPRRQGSRASLRGAARSSCHVYWRSAVKGAERDGMGEGYDSTVASVKESSLAALPESPWLGTDGFAKGSTITASDGLLNRLRDAAQLRYPAQCSGRPGPSG